MEKDLRKTFSRNLLMIMEERGLNQTQLAEGIGTSCSHVSKWIKMKSEPTLTYIYKITKFLNCTFEDLMQD